MATKQFLGGRIILGTEFSGYKFYFYEPGTSTPKTTYKDSSLTVGNENADPVVLDANGAAQIWFSGNADVTFKTSAGVTVYTDSNINLTASSTSTGTGNLSLNPSFEDDTDADGIPDNWTRTLYTSGAFVIDTTDSYNGAQSIKFTSTGTGGGYITSTTTFAVSPSVIYSIGWAMKGTVDVRNTVDVLWYKLDGSASATASTNVYDNSTTNPTSWTEKWYEATSPSDAAFASIRLTGCHSSDATAGNTRFDQVVFTDLVHKRSPNTLFKALAQAKGANVATAGNCDIWSPSDGDTLHLTGTATTTAFGTATQAGCRKDCIVDGTFVLATSSNLVMPIGTLTAVANDKFKVFADTTTKMYLLDYTRANGLPLSKGQQPISVKTASGTSEITFTASDFSWTDNKSLEFLFSGIYPTGSNIALQAQLSTNMGTTWISAGSYQYAGVGNDSAGTSNSSAAVNQTQFVLTGGMVNGGIGNGTNYGLSGDFTLFNHNSTGLFKSAFSKVQYWSNAATHAMAMVGHRYNGTNADTAAVNGVRFFPSSGSVSGVISVYGKRDS